MLGEELQKFTLVCQEKDAKITKENVQAIDPKTLGNTMFLNGLIDVDVLQGKVADAGCGCMMTCCVQGKRPLKSMQF